MSTGNRRGLSVYLNGLERLKPEQEARRIAALRNLAERARENAAARGAVERLLTFAAQRHPEEVQTFRACYLDGEKRDSARQIGRRLCMDLCTVHRHNRRILGAMLPAAFGVCGVFQSGSEREEAEG